MDDLAETDGKPVRVRLSDARVGCSVCVPSSTSSFLHFFSAAAQYHAGTSS
jgi:hypothetical protein